MTVFNQRRDHSLEMDDQRNELEDRIADIKNDMKKIVLECTDLRDKLQSTEATLDRERTSALNTQSKLEALTSVLQKTQNDLQSLNLTYNKTVNRLNEDEKRIERYEQNIDGEIANRIG